MTPAEYIKREAFEWDGGVWSARTLAKHPEHLARELRSGKFGPMFGETASRLAEGGTFDVTSPHGSRTYTVVFADGLSRLYQRTADATAVRRDFPGSPDPEDYDA